MYIYMIPYKQHTKSTGFTHIYFNMLIYKIIHIYFHLVIYCNPYTTIAETRTLSYFCKIRNFAVIDKEYQQCNQFVITFI